MYAIRSYYGVNKQFLLLENIPVLIHSIKAFDIIDDVSEIIVVTNEDSIDKTTRGGECSGKIIKKVPAYHAGTKVIKCTLYR